MGLFHRNENEANFAGGSKNVMEVIKRANDTNTLIYLDPVQDFNTSSVIVVAPNEQAIFIKNGELYGILPSGRHYVQTESYPLLSRIRNALTGGISSFTCQVYHVQTNEQKVNWGTAAAIEIQDYFLGRGEAGVPAFIRGAAVFRVRFNINEDRQASIRSFLHLMGDKSIFTVSDLEDLFAAEISQKISSVVGKTLEQMSMQRSINAISSQLEDFSILLKPYFDKAFLDYGLELVNFSFLNLSIEDDDKNTRRQILNRRIAEANVRSAGYNMAVQQELLENLTLNPGAGGVASAGAGIGMGVVAGGAFAQMASTAFGNPQPQQPPQPQGFGGQSRFGTNPQPQQSASQPDPMESLSKLKQLLDAGLIKQEQYDAKVAEVMNRL